MNPSLIWEKWHKTLRIAPTVGDHYNNQASTKSNRPCELTVDLVFLQSGHPLNLPAEQLSLADSVASLRSTFEPTNAGLPD